MTQAFKAPTLPYLVLEQRFFSEQAVFRATQPWLLGRATHKHPVLVLPGLGGTDRSTAQLRGTLGRQGHAVHGWELGRHGIWSRESVAAVQRRVETLYEEHGEPLSLVGISAGGILARELAREHPELVRQVVTIVSPFRHRSGDDNRMARLLSRVNVAETDHFQGLPREEDRAPLPMPSASIYSKSDGLIDWRSCLEVPGDRRDDIEVRSSHLGAGTNVAVAVAVLNRLDQPAQAWTPFRPPLAARPLFPQHSWWGHGSSPEAEDPAVGQRRLDAA